MKTKSIIISTTFICLLPVCSLMAECITNENQQEEIATMLKNYTQYATSKDEASGVYELCFNETQYFGKNESQKKNIEITVPNSHKLKIVGLRFPDPTDKIPLDLTADDKIFVLSGANTTIDGGFFTGNGNGTAIRVNGTNVEIKNSTFEKFEKGIVVGGNGTVKLSKNTYFLVPENIYTGVVASSINKVGKYLNKDNPLKVDYVIGEMDLSVCSSNAGSVEIYLEPSQMTDYIVKYHNTAKCSTPAFLTEDVTLEYADKHKETLKKDVTCTFKCDNLNDTVETSITFVYTTADGITNDFAPMPIQKYTGLPTVITITGTYVMTATPSGADTGTIIVAGYTGTTETTDTAGTGNIKGAIGGPNIDGAGDNGGGSSDGSSNNSDDDGLVNQEAGSNSATGCTIITGATTDTINRVTTALPTIFALLGLIPIAWRRVVRK